MMAVYEKDTCNTNSIHHYKWRFPGKTLCKAYKTIEKSLKIM
jgi:hypothetical protein